MAPMGEHQVVGGKLARGQTLQVQIGLGLGMERLMGPMIGIQRDHRLRIQRVGQDGIPALRGHLRQEQPLAVGQDRALGEAEDPAHGHRPHMGVFLPDGHAFARAGDPQTASASLPDSPILRLLMSTKPSTSSSNT